MNTGIPVTKRKPIDQLTMQGPATYRIIVQGRLDPGWASRLAGMSITDRVTDNDSPETVLVGRLPDQAALAGILNTLYDLHLPVISADCLESG